MNYNFNVEGSTCGNLRTVKCTIRILHTSQQIMCRYDELTVLCHHLDTLSGGKHPDPPFPAGLAVWAVESSRVVKGVLTALVSSVEGGANKTTNAIHWNAIELRTFVQSFLKNAKCQLFDQMNRCVFSNVYKSSFVPRAKDDWNAIPWEIGPYSILSSFKNILDFYLYCLCYIFILKFDNIK